MLQANSRQSVRAPLGSRADGNATPSAALGKAAYHAAKYEAGSAEQPLAPPASEPSFKFAAQLNAAAASSDAHIVAKTAPGTLGETAAQTGPSAADGGARIGGETLAQSFASTSASPSSSDVLADLSAIPDTLVIEVKLPDPPALPPVDCMTAIDCVRELAAVYCQREAETAAAIEASDRLPSAAAAYSTGFLSPKTAGSSTGAPSVHGSLELCLRTPAAGTLVSNRGGAAAGGGMASPGAGSGGASGASPSSNSLRGFTSPAGAAAAGSPAHSQLDDAEGTGEEDEIAACSASGSPFKAGLHPSLFGVDCRYVGPEGSFNPEHWLADRKGVAVRAAAGSVAGPKVEVPASSVTTAPSPTVRLVLSLPAHLHAKTAAFDVPRAAIQAGMPHVGAAPCQDAVAALRTLLSAAVPAPVGMDGHGSIPAVLETPAQLAARVTRAIGLLSAHVRPWIHAGLSPASSEARVQALIDRVKDLTGYDITTPVAPLAQTRLGSAHTTATTVARAVAAGGSAKGRSAEDSGSALVASPGFKRYFGKALPAGAVEGQHGTPGGYGAGKGHGGSALSASLNRTPGVATPLALKTGARLGLVEKAAPVCLASSHGPGGAGIGAGGGLSFNLTARALFHSPTVPRGPHSAVKRAIMSKPNASIAAAFFGQHGHGHGHGMGGGSGKADPLMTPQIVQEAPPSSLTPPRGAQRALARYVSSRDQTRPGVEPASLDREYHQGILGTMQHGLTAMSEQRRAEESHMLSCTGVKPAKDPRTGGYMYIHVASQQRVDPHTYEEVYLREVNYASDFLSEQARMQWAQEAEDEKARRVALAEIPDALAVELARAASFAAAKLSWWEQDVEEGFALSGSIVLGPGLAPEGQEEGTAGGIGEVDGEVAGVPSSSSSSSSSTTTTVGSLLQGAVMAWMGAVADARVEAVVRAMVAAEERAQAEAAALEEAEVVVDENQQGEEQGAAPIAAATADISVASVAAAAGFAKGVVDGEALAGIVRSVLPTLLAPITNSASEDGDGAAAEAAEQLQASIFTGLALYARSKGVSIIGGPFAQLQLQEAEAAQQQGQTLGMGMGAVSPTSAAIMAANGYSANGSFGDTLPFGFSLGGEGGFMLEATGPGAGATTGYGAGINGYTGLDLGLGYTANGYEEGENAEGAGFEGITTGGSASDVSVGFVVRDAIKALVQEQEEGAAAEAAEAERAGAVHAHGANASLTGILVQLLPSHSGHSHTVGADGEGFPAARLFDGAAPSHQQGASEGAAPTANAAGEGEMVSDAISTITEISTAVTSSPGAESGIMSEGDNNSSGGLLDLDGLDVSSLANGLTTLPGFIPSDLATSMPMPFCIRIDASSIITGGAGGVEGGAAASGGVYHGAAAGGSGAASSGRDSPSALPSDDTHGSVEALVVVPGAIPEGSGGGSSEVDQTQPIIIAGGEGASSSSGGAGASSPSFRPAAASAGAFGGPGQAGTSSFSLDDTTPIGGGAAPSTAAAGFPTTPGRIAPTMLKVFSPQAQGQSQGQAPAQQQGYGHGYGYGHGKGGSSSSLPFLSPSGTGLTARVHAATASLSLPALPAGGGYSWSSSSGSLYAGEEASSSGSGSAFTRPAGHVLPPLPFSASPINSSAPGAAAGATNSYASFSARAAEALRLFDAAIGIVPPAANSSSGNSASSASVSSQGRFDSASTVVAGVSPSSAGAIAASAVLNDARALVKAVTTSPGGISAAGGSILSQTPGMAGLTAGMQGLSLSGAFEGPGSVNSGSTAEASPGQAAAAGSGSGGFVQALAPGPRGVRPPPRPIPADGVPAGKGSGSGISPIVSPVRLAPLPAPVAAKAAGTGQQHTV